MRGKIPPLYVFLAFSDMMQAWSYFSSTWFCMNRVGTLTSSKIYSSKVFYLFIQGLYYCTTNSFFSLVYCIWYIIMFTYMQRNRLVPNQLENCNFNLNLVWFNKIQKKIYECEEMINDKNFDWLRFISLCHSWNLQYIACNNKWIIHID